MSTSSPQSANHTPDPQVHNRHAVARHAGATRRIRVSNPTNPSAADDLSTAHRQLSKPWNHRSSNDAVSMRGISHRGHNYKEASASEASPTEFADERIPNWAVQCNTRHPCKLVQKIRPMPPVHPGSCLHRGRSPRTHPETRRPQAQFDHTAAGVRGQQ